MQKDRCTEEDRYSFSYTKLDNKKSTKIRDTFSLQANNSQPINLERMFGEPINKDSIIKSDCRLEKKNEQSDDEHNSSV